MRRLHVKVSVIQRSQGVGQTRASKGSLIAELRLVDTVTPRANMAAEENLFDGLDTTIMGMATLANAPDLNATFTQLQESIDAALQELRCPSTLEHCSSPRCVG